MSNSRNDVPINLVGGKGDVHGTQRAQTRQTRAPRVLPVVCTRAHCCADVPEMRKTRGEGRKSWRLHERDVRHKRDSIIPRDGCQVWTERTFSRIASTLGYISCDQHRNRVSIVSVLEWIIILKSVKIFTLFYF